MAVELLVRVRAEIEERLADLRPAVAEYEQLTGATDALGSADSVAGDEPPKSAASAKAAPPAEGARGFKAASRRSPATRAPRAPRKSRVPRTQPGKQPGRAAQASSAAGEAIVAALEHGSHTVAELVLVSALPAAEIRAGVRPLLKSGTVTRTKRDGKAAYALYSAE